MKEYNYFYYKNLVVCIFKVQWSLWEKSKLLWCELPYFNYCIFKNHSIKSLTITTNRDHYLPCSRLHLKQPPTLAFLHAHAIRLIIPSASACSLSSHLLVARFSYYYTALCCTYCIPHEYKINASCHLQMISHYAKRRSFLTFLPKTFSPYSSRMFNSTPSNKAAS